jgi:hypothetical protein
MSAPLAGKAYHFRAGSMRLPADMPANSTTTNAAAEKQRITGGLNFFFINKYRQGLLKIGLFNRFTINNEVSFYHCVLLTQLKVNI